MPIHQRIKIKTKHKIMHIKGNVQKPDPFGSLAGYHPEENEFSSVAKFHLRRSKKS